MGIFSFLKKDKKQNKQQTVVRQEQKQQETIRVPAEINGQKCAFQYSKVYITLAVGVNLDSIFGQRVALGFDSVEFNGQYIGRISNVKLSDMVNDWLRRGEPVFAVVSHIDEDNYFAAIDLYLYRDELKYLLRRFPEAKPYKLTGNRRGELQDNIGFCERGEECSIEYDIDKEKYLVSAGSDIGYLPAAAAKIAEEQGESNLSVYIASVSSDDEGIDEVSVYIFPKMK